MLELVLAAGGDKSGRWLSEKAPERGKTYWGGVLSGERSPNTSDIDYLAKALEIDPADLMRGVFVAAEREMAEGRVTPIRPNDSGYLDDAVHGLDTAAGTDETQANEFD